MRHVPDLVFLNCCHLAKMGPEAKGTNPVAYNKLAASLSRELIEMGVRAVVAAGWAVRDDAANKFAEVFYTAMFDGATFGDALHKARKETWSQFRDCNTWGAYQAYGDPDFRLNTDKTAGEKSDCQPYASLEEMLYDLGSIHIKSQDISNAETKEMEQQWKKSLLQEMADLKEKCPAAWLAQGAVSSRFARAYSELGEFKIAIDYYQKALSADGGGSGVHISAAEQLANLEARLGGKQNNPKLIEKAIERLQHLIAFGRTLERLALLGSAYKRLAQVLSDRKGMTEALTQSATYYKEAAETGVQRSQFDPYHGLNWITLETLLGNKLSDAESWLARCEAVAVERYAASRKLWDAVASPDADIARRLLRGDLKAEAVDTIVAGYRKVFITVQATLREQDSVIGQLDFIQTMLERLGGHDATVDTIKDILRGLAGEKKGKTSTIAVQLPLSKLKGGSEGKNGRKQRTQQKTKQ
jgi:tetratricopeptide (TPR) repeat protein